MDVFPKVQIYPGDPAVPYPIVKLLTPPAPPKDAYFQIVKFTVVRSRPNRYDNAPGSLFSSISSGNLVMPHAGKVTLYIPERLMDNNGQVWDLFGWQDDVSKVPTAIGNQIITSSSNLDGIINGYHRWFTYYLCPFSIKTEKPNLVYNSGYAFTDNILDTNYTNMSGTVPDEVTGIVHFNIDLGSITNVGCIAILFRGYNSATGINTYLDISTDGTTWTNLKSWLLWWSSSYDYFYHTRLTGDWNFRYIRLRSCGAGTLNTYQYMYVYHLLVFPK